MADNDELPYWRDAQGIWHLNIRKEDTPPVSNTAQTGVSAVQGNAPAFLQSIDYVMGSAGRVMEGILGFKLLNSELEARKQQAQWQQAAYGQLYGSQVGTSGSPWGAPGAQGGIGILQPGGVNQAGMFGTLPGGPLIPLLVGAVLLFAAVKD